MITKIAPLKLLFQNPWLRRLIDINHLLNDLDDLDLKRYKPEDVTYIKDEVNKLVELFENFLTIKDVDLEKYPDPDKLEEFEDIPSEVWDKRNDSLDTCVTFM